MSFRITGLAPEAFQPLFGLSEAELAARGVKRYAVDKKPGFPDRVELRDAEPGESVLLLNYVHQPADSAYRASHAIFVVEGAKQRYDRIDEIPQVMRSTGFCRCAPSIMKAMIGRCRCHRRHQGRGPGRSGFWATRR